MTMLPNLSEAEFAELADTPEMVHTYDAARVVNTLLALRRQVDAARALVAKWDAIDGVSDDFWMFEDAQNAAEILGEALDAAESGGASGLTPGGAS